MIHGPGAGWQGQVCLPASARICLGLATWSTACGWLTPVLSRNAPHAGKTCDKTFTGLKCNTCAASHYKGSTPLQACRSCPQNQWAPQGETRSGGCGAAIPCTSPWWHQVPLRALGSSASSGCAWCGAAVCLPGWPVHVHVLPARRPV